MLLGACSQLSLKCLARPRPRAKALVPIPLGAGALLLRCVNCPALTYIVISPCSFDTKGVKAKDFGKELKALRERLGMTQLEAAKLIGSDYAHSFGAYETGKRIPRLDQAEKLVKALGCRLELQFKKP